ncbi:MAG: tetratricopeptide repeat protein [Anaerolineae bacterium]|nr:tetratricopeptide repeat protein [Anaerolineae bacterium]
MRWPRPNAWAWRRKNSWRRCAPSSRCLPHCARSWPSWPPAGPKSVQRKTWNAPWPAGQICGQGWRLPLLPGAPTYHLSCSLFFSNSPTAASSDMPRTGRPCRHTFPCTGGSECRLWAGLHVELGNSLVQNPLGDRAENLEQAIAAYRQALEVLTRQAMPVEWAQVMLNLANAYSDRIRGDRAENLEQAIAAYRQALEVMTRQAMPVEWATVMMNLANAYSDRIRGDRAENLEEAIAAYRQALEVKTREAMPVEWATVMMNLANAYNQRIRGDRRRTWSRASPPTARRWR